MNNTKHYKITFEGFLRYGLGCLWDLFDELNKIRIKNDLQLFIHEVKPIQGYCDKDTDFTNQTDITIHLLHATKDELKIVMDYLTTDTQEHFKKYGELMPQRIIQNVKVREIV
jgi:hypothetical protein|tara:strand:- start:38 stop:376 length:339 start_codon:yes stop_codon:yes gene_type:complete